MLETRAAIPPLFTLISILLATSSAAGQTVRGVLTDAGSGTPVSGAVVVLEDSLGNERVFGLADQRGRFTLRADHAGAFVLRIDRVGFESIWSPPLVVLADEVREFEIPVPAVPIDLGGLAVTADRCAPRPAWPPQTEIVWAEVRKVLVATALVDAAAMYRYEVRETGVEPVAGGAAPQWRDVHPLAYTDSRWATEGFVRRVAGEVTFQPLVPAILVTSDFVMAHCFGIAIDSATNRVGVRFEPLDSSRVGVQGAVWVDEATGVLESLDYRYANLPGAAAGLMLGGSLRFAPLPDGGWLIDEWSSTTTSDLADGISRIERAGSVVAAVPVFRLDGPNATLLTGVVIDSTSGGRPLAGARVFLWGTDYQTTTDTYGRFVFPSTLPPGDYSASFFHERLDDWDVVPTAREVSVRAGVQTSLTLGVPSIAGIVARRCADTGGGVVVGTVRDHVADLPLPLARVVVDWTIDGGGRDDQGRVETRTDGRGWYHVCGLPRSVPLVIRAQYTDEWTSGNVVVLERDSLATQHIEVSVSELVEVVGRVLDESTEDPVADATVRLVGVDAVAISGEDGRFLFPRLAPGFYEVAVVHPDYGAVADTVTVRGEGAAEVIIHLGVGASSVALNAGADSSYQLDPILVEGRAVVPGLADFERRRAAGWGGFATREEFEKWAPVEVTDVIRRMPGFAVRANPTRGWTLPNGSVDLRENRIEVTTKGRRRHFECPPIVFVDGGFVGNTQRFDVDDLLAIEWVEAVETYPLPGQTPAEFNRDGSECGVIVFWTRR